MFKLILSATNRSRAMITIMIALVLGGTLSYINIPKEADPDIPIPVIYVGVSLPGISPADAERLLVKPLEIELQRLEGLKEITSTASQHHGSVILEFDVSFDKDKALTDVREKVSVVRAEFPDDANEPIIREFNASLFPVISINLSGDVPERELYRRARTLEDAIATLPNVHDIELIGHREEVLEVIIDPARLQNYGVSTDQLLSVIRRNNQLVPAGALDSTSGRFSINVPGLIENADDLYNLPVKKNGDAIVRLSDIASIQRKFKDASVIARFNGQPTIAVSVTKRIGTNLIDTVAQVRALTNEFTADWPKNISVDFSADFSTFIFEMIGSLELSIINAIILVMLLVVAALGIRSSLLVGAAIPISFLTAFLIISTLGFTLNMMIMFGLVLSVGMLVDGAVVIVEYADRKMAEGIHRGEAYAMAARRMFLPIFASTATTLAAFGPLLLWPGVSGKFMSFLPITVIIVLSASFVTAMLFLPVLGGLFGKTTQANDSVLSSLAADSDTNVLDTPGFTGKYVRFLHKCIIHPWRSLGIATLVLISIILLFSKFNKGIEFFTYVEPDYANIYVKARGNISVQQADRLTREVERIAFSEPGIDNIFTSAGALGSGTPSQSQSGGPNRGEPSDLIGRLTVEMSQYKTRDRVASEILAEVERRASAIPGIIVETSERESGPPTGKELQIELSGDNFADLITATKRVRAYIDSRPDQLTDIEDSLPLPGIEWDIVIDREAAGRFNVDITAVGSVVQLITEGLLLAKYRPDDSEDELDIRLRYPHDARSINALDQLRVSTPSGLVPITNFMHREPVKRVDTITRVDGARIFSVKANTRVDPATGDKILADVAASDFKEWAAENLDLPTGVRMRIRGANEEQADAAAFLGVAMIASLFLMFIILLMQFNSIYYSILTLLTIVLATMGVMLGMVLTGHTFSVILTGTGIVALSGIVVNNSIVLIDTFQRLVKTGISHTDAVLRTAGQRLRPIMITTITTMAGLLPMAAQVSINIFSRETEYITPISFWWVQLATAIIFGLGFSTLLTLILIPVLIDLPNRIRNTVHVPIFIKRRLMRGVPVVQDATDPSEEEHILPQPGE